jgi:hypothetical protein
MITLGSDVDQLTVIIPIGASFITTLTASTPWPNGTIIQLQFMNDIADVPVVWSATVSGTDATFNVADTSVVTNARLSLARLIYNPGGTGALLWAHGTVRYV